MLSNKQNLDRLAADNCLKLFAHYQLEMQAGVTCDVLSDRQFLVCGVIGFTAKYMRGALVLAATQEPLARTCPGNAGCHRDWICELANQLLGRVKNQLLNRGIEIHQSTPVSLRGGHLSPVLLQRPIAELFTAGDGIVCVWMDCEFDGDFAIPETGLEDDEGIEGEVMFF